MDRSNKNQVRKLSLEHWFINYQLKAIQKSHMHLPGSIDVDVTTILQHLKTDRPATYLTSVVIKALGLVLETNPELNCIYADSVFGPRLICPDYVAINVPVRVQVGDKHVLSAHVVKAPQSKSITEIRDELKATRFSGLEKRPIARFVSTKSNNFVNRSLLKMLHFVAYNFPNLYVSRGGGGASVSSLLYEGKDASPMTTTAFGPTGFTCVLTSTWSEGSRTLLRIGVGFDHLIGSGELAVVFGKKLAAVLNGDDVALHARLLDLQQERAQRAPFAESAVIN